MAHDHFKIPPDPKMGHGIIKNPQKSKNLLELAKLLDARSAFSTMTTGLTPDVVLPVRPLASQLQANRMSNTHPVTRGEALQAGDETG